MIITKYLLEKHVPFEVCMHPKASGARAMAEAMHVPCKDVAKTVLLRINGGFKHILAILPATHVVDLQKLSHVFGGTHVELATKAEVAAHCPDCDAGVLPPFGTHYGMETVVDPKVEVNEQIVFEGNTRTEAIRMRYRDFYNLEHPLVAEFAVPVETSPVVSPTP